MNDPWSRPIAVVGAGTMGSQIAQQCALHGFEVRLMDSDAGQLHRASASNRAHLGRRVDRGKLNQDEMDRAIRRVSLTTDLGHAVGEAEFVIEAVVEDLAAKQRVFAELERVAPLDAVLATNSSTIGSSRIVAELQTKSRCLNMHFFHPVLVMKLCEIMWGPDTSKETVDRAMEFAQKVGKEVVLVNGEVFGLIVNRILGAIKREALWLVEHGYATPEDVDRAVKLGLNHPMGPFELTDFSGLDVFYQASQQQYAETGDERYRPSRLLEDLIRAGRLGRKSGRGFYEYPDPESIRR